VPEGYPDSPVKDEQINISKINNPDGLFYASVDIQNGKLVEAGSRTVAVVGVADSISNAEKIAEKEVSAISGPLFHRSDIGTDMVIQKRINHIRSLR
jgi:phosphoribosylamine--glycine ligase